MFAAYALNGRDQEFCVWLDCQTYHASDVDSSLPHSRGLHIPRLGINDSAPQQLCFFLVANVCAQFREFLQNLVMNLGIDDYRLFRGTNRSVVEGLGGNDVHYRHIQVGGLLQVHR